MSKFLRLLYYYLLIYLTTNINLNAQSPTLQDCFGARPICQNIDTTFVSYHGMGNYPNEIPWLSCLSMGGESNSIWYTFTVQTSGIFGFLLTPNNLTDDYDWAVFNLTTSSCSQLYSNFNNLIVSCNSSGQTGQTGISSFYGGTANSSGPSGGNKYNADLPVLAGQTYVIMISNWSGGNNGYIINFSGSTAQIFDNVPPHIDSILFNPACGSDSLTFTFSEYILCNTLLPCDLELTGPGGPYTITSVSGLGCSIGGNIEKIFTVKFNPSVTTTGIFNLNLVSSNCNSVTDLCGNVAPSGGLTFSINALSINTSSISPYCSVNSGIAKVLANGANGNYNYLWSTSPPQYSSIASNIPAGTYYVVVNSGNCSITDTAIVVDVISLNAGTNDTICKGDSIQLQASGGLIYNWSPTAGLSNPNIANPFVYPLQTTTYYVNAQIQGTNLINNGDFELGNIGFMSSYSYSTNLSPDGIYCVGINPQTYYSGFSPCPDHTSGTGKMMIINGSTIPNTIVLQQNIIIKPNTNYAFSIWAQNISNSTTELAQLQFKINGNLISSIFTIPSTQCLWGNFYTQWFSGNDSIITISILNQNTQANGNDFCLDDICFSELYSCIDSVNILVLNPPQLSLGNDTIICIGQNNMLSAGSGFNSYFWSTSETTQQIVVQNTGIYWLKAFTNEGCYATDTIQEFFFQTQENIFTDTILCLGQNVIFNPGVGYTNHLWSTGAITASLNVNLPGTFWLQVKQPNGCVVKDTAIVKYDSLNIVVSSFANPSCYGGNNGSINTTTTGLYPGFTYSWNTTPVITTANISMQTAGNYTITVTDSKGCTKSVSKTLTAPNPVAVSLGNDTSICQGQSLTLQATQIFTSYLWSTGATTQSINVNALGTYWHKGTNAAGCSGYDTININVNPAPVIQVAPSNPAICNGDSITLLASSTIAGTTFNWSNGGNGSSISILPLNTTIFSVIGSKNACKDTATVTVTVNPIPVVTISPANPSICKGDAVTLTASSNLANTTFLWNNNSTNTTINVSPNTNTNYFVVGSLSPCKDTAFVTVTTKPLPVLSVTADKNPICEGETVKLTASSDIASTTYLWSNTSTAGFINVSPLSSSYYFVTGTASNCLDTAGINITVISKQTLNLGEDRYLCAGDEVNLTATNLTGSYLWSNGSNSSTIILTEPGVYWLRVDNNGCIASDTIEMKKCSEIWVPNVFTPNEDGINDIFKPVVTEIQKLTINIYNRWGEMIFETSDINGGWNGKIHNNEAPTGVYFWIIKYYENRSSAQDIQKEIKGSVTLLR